jgi:hypothetical protein
MSRAGVQVAGCSSLPHLPQLVGGGLMQRGRRPAQLRRRGQREPTRSLLSTVTATLPRSLPLCLRPRLRCWTPTAWSCAQRGQGAPGRGPGASRAPESDAGARHAMGACLAPRGAHLLRGNAGRPQDDVLADGRVLQDLQEGEVPWRARSALAAPDVQSGGAVRLTTIRHSVCCCTLRAKVSLNTGLRPASAAAGERCMADRGSSGRGPALPPLAMDPTSLRLGPEALPRVLDGAVGSQLACGRAAAASQEPQRKLCLCVWIQAHEGRGTALPLGCPPKTSTSRRLWAEQTAGPAGGQASVMRWARAAARPGARRCPTCELHFGSRVVHAPEAVAQELCTCRAGHRSSQARVPRIRTAA